MEIKSNTSEKDFKNLLKTRITEVPSLRLGFCYWNHQSKWKMRASKQFQLVDNDAQCMRMPSLIKYCIFGAKVFIL